MYIDNFAVNLNGLREKLPYIQQAGVNLLHLMPFLDTVPERSACKIPRCSSRKYLRYCFFILCWYRRIGKKYNVTTMCTTWHTVATKDTRLLRRQLDAVNALPKKYVFLNYLRCHTNNSMNLWAVATICSQFFPYVWHSINANHIHSFICQRNMYFLIIFAVMMTLDGDWIMSGLI